jgi:hypothetical protein
MALTCKNLVEPETRIELVTYALRVLMEGVLTGSGSSLLLI